MYIQYLCEHDLLDKGKEHTHSGEVFIYFPADSASRTKKKSSLSVDKSLSLMFQTKPENIQHCIAEAICTCICVHLGVCHLKVMFDKPWLDGRLWHNEILFSFFLIWWGEPHRQ